MESTEVTVDCSGYEIELGKSALMEQFFKTTKQILKPEERILNKVA